MSFKTTLLLAGVLLAGCVLPPKEASHPAALADTRVGLTGAAVEPILTVGGTPSTIRSSTA